MSTAPGQKRLSHRPRAARQQHRSSARAMVERFSLVSVRLNLIERLSLPTPIVGTFKCHSLIISTYIYFVSSACVPPKTISIHHRSVVNQNNIKLLYFFFFFSHLEDILFIVTFHQFIRRFRHIHIPIIKARKKFGVRLVYRPRHSCANVLSLKYRLFTARKRMNLSFIYI